MARLRVATLAVTLVVAMGFAAQPVPRGQIQIEVKDLSGAFIPGADIEVDPSPDHPGLLTHTDKRGKAALDLATGSHVIAVRSSGFKVWKGQVEVRATQNPLVLVTLEIAPNGNPVVIEEENLKPAVEHSSLDATIAPDGTNSVTIRTAHNSAPELATKVQLERLLAAHDLRQWTFTHDIVIDEKSIPHSHPVLTLHTRHLKQDDELLSTYVHEQLHWFLTRHPAETKAAEQDLAKLYPEVPVGYPEGANDTESTYLHLLVCRLEQEADRAVLGEQRTAEVMQFWAGDHYRWVYRAVLADGAKIDEILKRHGLADPDARIAATAE